MSDRPLMHLLDSPVYTVPCPPRDWRRLIRRIRFGSPALKAIAGVLADQADYTTGDNIHIGIARIARASETNPKTVRTALRRLRELLLVDRTYEGGAGKAAAGDTDRYRLSMPSSIDWLLSKVDMLDPDEQELTPRAGGMTPSAQNRRSPDVAAVDNAQAEGMRPPAQMTRTARVRLEQRVSVPRAGGVRPPGQGASVPPTSFKDTSPLPPPAISSLVPPELEDSEQTASPVENPRKIAHGRSPPLASARRCAAS